MKTKTHTEESGFTLLEMLIAMIVLAIGLLGIAALQLTAIQGSSYSIKSSQATAQLSDIFENMKTLSLDDIQSKAGTRTVGIYTITTTVTEGPAGTKQVVLTASWQDPSLKRTVNTTYRTYFAPK